MTEEMKPSESPRALSSFWSLPNDVALNILARISRIHHPSLSLVSKRFKSILSSRELDVTRTLMDKTEKHIYLYLKFRRHTKPCWFALTPGPDQKLKQLPSFPYEHHPDSPTVVSSGSEFYLIGGLVNHRRSRRVFVLDCRCQKWRKLPEMRVPRGSYAAAGFIDGKLYVLGGRESSGEVYDPKSGTWEPYMMNIQKDVMLGNFGYFVTNTCFIAEEKILCRVVNHLGVVFLTWCDLGDKMGWRQVKGLEGLFPVPPDFVSVASPEGGRRLTVWWVSYQKEDDLVLVSEIEIWCAEISFQIRSREEVYGVVEWSKVLHAMNRSETGGVISLLSSAIVNL
ncbi:hypothetical protein HID58_051513 [Brassica napus]|uniref:F-box domain-containing protein n=1 Tax=Brassica napus TaxID=3708 RepID=A0ABQ8A957_BRANA|nr:F-box/kelch-repeat protein At5g03020 [Brassica napus]KAH0889084.1 hypothetical protein HID58_051513 [Brassica napus]